MQIWQIKERDDSVSSLQEIKRINIFNIIKKDMVKYNDLHPTIFMHKLIREYSKNQPHYYMLKYVKRVT